MTNSHHGVQASDQGNGKRAMAVEIPVIREVVERVCTGQDVLDACKRRDLGYLIAALCAEGMVQDQIAALVGKPQGRISQYMNHKVTPRE